MAEKKKGNFYEFTKGLIKENPTLVTLLGMCPTLAVTTMASNGIGMGLATTFVLVCSNIAISLLKNVIPKAVRLPCFIVVIASFVTLIEFLLKGYIPALYDSLGLFLSLITVNCIILGRAEAFASKNGVFASALDGLGMGLGFTLALFTMGSVREIIGTGQWMGINLHLPVTMTMFIMPAGGFFTLGCVIALVNKIANRKPPQEIGCAACPNAATCPTFNKTLGGKEAVKEESES
ncbi:MAG: electron transport complex subunit E [Clostridia bacterium]|nr:electron transport complex subunit E [Clostridia bacterium]